MPQPLAQRRSRAAKAGRVGRRERERSKLAQRHESTLEVELRRCRQDLDAANQELDGFVYSISHDLRAPLRAIDGFSRILEEDHGAALGEEGRRVTEVIRASSGRMNRLIDEILGYSRLGRAPLARVDLDMGRMAREVVPQCPAEHRSPQVTIGALPGARADAALMAEVWLTLLSNAVKFSSKREQPLIEVSALEQGAETVYRVRDNGVGFDMRYADRLFGMFQRLHAEQDFPGTGVGLARAKRILARHGGRIWAESAPDGGATFSYSLPKGEAS